MMLRCALLLACLLIGIEARADPCDALTARIVHATGASFAGRSGPLVVFRAADAERMSLGCQKPATLLFRSDRREPLRPYFILIGLAGRELTGADAERVEILALNLHQATLLTGAAQDGATGPLAMRCEAGDRPDGFNGGALCRITRAGPGRLRRRAGLFAAGPAG